MPPLTDHVDLSREMMWDALTTLRARVTGATADEVLRAIVDVFGADQGCLVRFHHAGGSSIICGVDADGALAPAAREEIGRTLVETCRQSGEAVMWDGVRDGSESAIALGIVAALATPMHVAGELIGALYLDVRNRRRYAGPLHLEFAQAASELAAVALDPQGDPSADAMVGPRPFADAPALTDLLDLPGLLSLDQEVRAGLLADLPILISGETGVGKTLFAHAIGAALGAEPVVRVTLGSSDDLNTITSELFGHERGSFSGAASRRAGLIELANDGVLVLDEVLNLPLAAQQLLLDFTQFGTYRPLGHAATAPKHARVQLISVTQGDLGAEVEAGRFRRDLHHRLAGFVLRIPPLRERLGDIPALALRFLQRADPNRPWALSLDARRALLAPYEWPGNVRELEHIIRRARALALVRDADATLLSAAELGHAAAVASTPSKAANLDDEWTALSAARAELDAREAAIIRRALDRFGGVVSRTARALGAKRTSLLSRMRTLGIERPDLP